jgi:hypothetical protein
MELVRMHRDDRAPSVADFRADAPARLESLAAAALAKDPADRPADGAALLRELRGGHGDATMIVSASTPPNATDATQILPRPARPPRRGRRALWAVPLAVALVGGGVALALITTGGGETTPTTTPLPGLSLPTVPTAGSTKPTTTAPSTTQPTTQPTTTARTTTAPTTTAAVTTVPVTPPQTVLPTTTVAPPPTTTLPSPPPATTVPATTDTTSTTAPSTTTSP